MKEKDRKTILWISLFALYDDVPHAGGKNGNFYLKELSKEDYDIRCLSFPYINELEKLDYEKYGIEDDHKCYKDSKNRVLRLADIYWSIIKRIRKYKREGYCPNVILIQWTELSFLIGYIKKVFPNAKCIVIEEDVAFLAYQRYYLKCRNLLKKVFLYIFYKTVKLLEIHSIRISDIVICNNSKDKKLLINEGVENSKIFQWVVYYQDFSAHKYRGNKDHVLFYGAMKRKENHDSAVWFDQSVMPLIKDLGLKFRIIGGGVRPELKDILSENAEIVGFVDDPGVYFEDALCLVVPLVLGAGIKVKVLEGMKMGIPIITNAIGIEGIPATDGIDYLHAETPEEFSEAIRRLVNESELAQRISNNSRDFIKKNFDITASGRMFCDLIAKVVENSI